MGTTWDVLGDQLIAQAKLKRVPLIGQFELTSRCNLRCKMCYICRPVKDDLAKTKERSARDWIELAKEARNAGLLYLLLTGGEVFVREDFKSIYEELALMGFNIEIFTNATLITPEIAKWLGKIPPSKVGITLYGASEETYEKVCGDGSAFERTIRAIDLLLAEGIVVDLKTTVIKSNVSDFSRIEELASNRGIKLSIVNYISPKHQTDNTCPRDERLTPQELAEFEEFVKEYSDSNGTASSNNELSDICSDEYSRGYVFKNTLQDQSTNDAFSCSAGKCAFWITWDGRMTPCGLMDQPKVLPFDIGFINAWQELQNACCSIPRCEECMNCRYAEYCITCPARLKNESGAYDRPAPYICEVAKHRAKITNLTK